MSSNAQIIVKKISEEEESFWSKINWKQHWKYSFIGLIPFFYFYPKALIFIVNPFVRPFVESYRKKNQLQTLPQTVILTSQSYLDIKKTIEKVSKLRRKNIEMTDYHVIDLFSLPQAQKPQNNQTTCLWAQTIVNKLQYLGKTNTLIIIKASTGVLQGIEILLYNMKLQQSYKIGLYGQNVHVLYKNDTRKSYQRQTIRIDGSD